MGVSIKLVTNNGDEDNELEKNVQDKNSWISWLIAWETKYKMTSLNWLAN